MTSRATNGDVGIQECDHVELCGPVVLLAGREDARALPALCRLLADASCPREFLKDYLGALRRIGNAECVEMVRDIAKRHPGDTGLHRQAALTEKVLMAKMSGRDVLKNAEEELRRVTLAWVAAINARDMEGYLSVLPSLARGGVDEYDFNVELLGAAELPDILEAAKRAAEAEDSAFRIDRDNFEAFIVVGRRYKFLYILELDGRKISGPLRVGR